MWKTNNTFLTFFTSSRYETTLIGVDNIDVYLFNGLFIWSVPLHGTLQSSKRSHGLQVLGCRKRIPSPTLLKTSTHFWPIVGPLETLEILPQDFKTPSSPFYKLIRSENRWICCKVSVPVVFGQGCLTVILSCTTTPTPTLVPHYLYHL